MACCSRCGHNDVRLREKRAGGYIFYTCDDCLRREREEEKRYKEKNFKVRRRP